MRQAIPTLEHEKALGHFINQKHEACDVSAGIDQQGIERSVDIARELDLFRRDLERFELSALSRRKFFVADQSSLHGQPVG